MQINIRRRLLLPLLIIFHWSAASGQTLVSMEWHRRVILVFAADERDASLQRQREKLSGWKGAEERDVSMVHVIGPRTQGSTDSADALRNRFAISADQFAVLLVGKDGHIAARFNAPVSSADFEALIDSMPMRKAGQR